MSYFSAIEKWTIPVGAWEASLDELALDGQYGREGIAMWLGRRVSGIASVGYVALLRGSGIRKRRYLIEIDAGLVNDLTDAALERNVVLLGQIHSHAPECATDLSIADRQYGISVPHFLSVVAPEFALRPPTQLADCGVHVFEPPLGFRRLHQDEAAQRFSIVETGESETIIVGD
jgi:hypothetical protein